MEIFEMVWLGFVSVWLIGMGLWLETKNVRSYLFFKMTPVVLGLCAGFLLLNKLGFVIQMGK